MTKSLIALGSNIGATPALFHDALTALERSGVTLEQLSSCHDTTPVGAASAGERFLNAAAIVSSSLSAEDLLAALQSVERSFGRQRDVRWGSRTLDLDLLLHGSAVVDLPTLLVPHPALWYRRFVLSSAVEIAGEWNHPLLKESLNALWQQLQKRPVRLALDFSCVSFQLSLAADGSKTQAVDFLSEESSSPHEGLFAAVQLVPSTLEQPRLSHQHAKAGERKILLFVEGAEDALEQVKMLAGAILG